MKYYAREFYKREKTFYGAYILVEYVEFFKTTQKDVSHFNKGLKIPFKRTYWNGVAVALTTLKEDTIYGARKKTLKRELYEKIQNDKYIEEKKRLCGDD